MSLVATDPYPFLAPCPKLWKKPFLRNYTAIWLMAQNGLFNDRSYAYKDGHSTLNALLDLSETWCENIDKNYQNVNTFLDMVVPLTVYRIN